MQLKTFFRNLQSIERIFLADETKVFESRTSRLSRLKEGSQKVFNCDTREIFSYQSLHNVTRTSVDFDKRLNNLRKRLMEVLKIFTSENFLITIVKSDQFWWMTSIVVQSLLSLKKITSMFCSTFHVQARNWRCW